MHDNYLVLTGQEEYANPFTHQPEIDVSSYDYRWVTESGERVYTNDKGFDPNRAQHTQGRTWKLSKPKSGM